MSTDPAEEEPRFVPRVIRPAAVDWVKFDADLARDGSVDPVDKALYAALASFADQDDRSTDDDGGNVPTRRVLAECIGRSLDTVDRSTKRLEAIGLIRVERRRDPKNPKSNLPSVYELRDHEWWDERAARRAAARREARNAGGGRMDAARGSRTDAARGGRMDAARGSRTSAAVLLLPEKFSLSEGEKTEEREKPAAPNEPTPTPDEDPMAEQAQAIAAAWTAGTGMPRIPSNEQEIHKRALELLREGHDPTHLAAVARWMSSKGWRDLGYALTAKGAPNAPSARQASRPAEKPTWCGKCDEVTRVVETGSYDDNNLQLSRCPDCHPQAARDSTSVPAQRRKEDGVDGNSAEARAQLMRTLQDVGRSV